MKILICGGRFLDATVEGRHQFIKAMNSLVRKQGGLNFTIIHGDCPTGADRLADVWAYLYGVDCKPFPADWKRHGNAAGPIRNQQMLDEGKPDAAVAFPGGRGTADMVRRCRAGSVPVWIPYGGVRE